MASIEELRHRAWNLSDKSVKSINTINEVLYKNMKYRPKVLPDFENEKTNDISIDYLNDLISKANENFKILEESFSVIDYIIDKHRECLNLVYELNIKKG